MDKQCALKIENLLRKVNPQRKYGCDDIELNPYQAICQELCGRVSNSLFQRFASYYKAIEGQSLLALVSLGFDVKKLVFDLKDIVNKHLKEID